MSLPRKFQKKKKTVMMKKKKFNRDIVSTLEEIQFYDTLPVKEVVSKKGIKKALEEKLIVIVPHVYITKKGDSYLDDYEVDQLGDED